MNKIYTYKKEILFKNNIYDILSFNIDDDLKIIDNQITGRFILTGDYLIRENEQDVFNIEIPYNNNLDSSYNLINSELSISDFYYEIKNNNILEINIELNVSNIEENVLEEMNDRFEMIDLNENLEDVQKNGNDNVDEKNYVTYKVYIVRDGDTLESIMDKYEINIETLTKYNIINELNSGDKLIIPYERD